MAALDLTKLTDVPGDHQIFHVTISLVGGRPGDQPLPSGSGVFIAPGVALTATHVLEDYWEHYGKEDGWQSDAEADFAVQVLQWVPDVDRPVLWHLRCARHLDPLDIAVMQLQRDAGAPDVPDSLFPTLDIAPLREGTEVQAFGYPESQVAYDNEAGGWTLTDWPAGAVGRVTQVFPDRRDRVKIPFPSFEMDLQILGGMSGGPVFNREGLLCGIVCSSFDLRDERNHVSYASLLGPSLEFPVQLTPELGGGVGEVRLAELVDRGYLEVHTSARS